MTDIRPKALEKARQRAAESEAQRADSSQKADASRKADAAPPGSGFQSELEKAKQALRDDVNSYTGENVQKIAAVEQIAQDERILRVAAYCRVSTDDLEQVVSKERSVVACCFLSLIEMMNNTGKRRS